MDLIKLPYYTSTPILKQCVRINNIYSGFEEIISGVPQGSIVRLILFNAFLNDLFYYIENASVHNFADDNTLSSFAKTVNPNLGGLYRGSFRGGGGGGVKLPPLV